MAEHAGADEIGAREIGPSEIGAGEIGPGETGDLLELSVSEASSLIRTGELTASEYADALIRQCERRSHCNAFIGFDPHAVRLAAHHADRARANGQRLGPLHGIPIAVKDNINTAALPTTGGTAALSANRPESDAVVVRRLAEAGALLLGKTNLHELGRGWTSLNATFGPVRNPRREDRIAGGSSGGSACAVAARMTPAALGTDTEGSIRIPAALCGVAGLRPSTGRYPMEGVIPIAASLDTVGPFARCVADIALLDSVLANVAPAPARLDLRGVRIGVPRTYYLDGLDSEVEQIFERALACLADRGADLVFADLTGLDTLVAGVAAALIRYEFARLLPEYLAVHAPGMSMRDLAAGAGPNVSPAFAPPPPEAGERHRAAREAQRRVRALFQSYQREYALDVIVHPVVPMPAPPIGAGPVWPPPGVTIAGREVPEEVAFGRNVSPASVAGLPGLVLPAGATPEGLPVGVEFNAASGHDEYLIAAGFAAESALRPAL
ncbi:amidase family protein [Rugosimonospora africana]|uniref:Indole acetimide hydrolase n=1 Tax=Rugosimonospora africana TaxID=556532 RepID=A0A8J3VVH2_9ACTN|nr:amidase family protein [Rugosimonospora africana]GIH19781.1 indole acetimide hydrolase [Rugosimonospora africana]